MNRDAGVSNRTSIHGIHQSLSKFTNKEEFNPVMHKMFKLKRQT